MGTIMKRLLLTAALLGAVGATPVYAANTALVLWNNANPGDAETASGTGAAALVGSSLDGITISVSAATRETSPANGLSEGNITITNTTGTVQVLDIIAGANGFLGPSSLFNLTGTIGVDSGSATLGGSFFVTQSNFLNGTAAGGVTGTDIGDFLSSLLTGPKSFSFNGSGIDGVTGTYGLAESLQLTLQPGAVIGVQNVSMDASAVPEPSTWVMMGGGFALLAALGLRKRRTPRFAV
jgi:PEP-CTERM motif